MVGMAARPTPGPRGRYKVERARQRRRNVATLITVAAMLTPIVLGSLWVLSNVETSPRATRTSWSRWSPIGAQRKWAAALEKTSVVKSAAEFQTYSEQQGVTTFKPGRYYFFETEGSTRSLATLRARRPRRFPIRSCCSHRVSPWRRSPNGSAR